VLPHGGIHGRGKHDLAGESEINGGEKVVGRPQANLASRLAVAGATTKMSFSAPPRYARSRSREYPAGGGRKQFGDDFASGEGGEGKRLNNSRAARV